jgi:hypothetical protein
LKDQDFRKNRMARGAAKNALRGQRVRPPVMNWMAKNQAASEEVSGQLNRPPVIYSGQRARSPVINRLARGLGHQY